MTVQQQGKSAAAGSAKPAAPRHHLSALLSQPHPQALITELIKVCPSYRPPSDYRPEKKVRKLRIPVVSLAYMIHTVPYASFLNLQLACMHQVPSRNPVVRNHASWTASRLCRSKYMTQQHCNGLAGHEHTAHTSDTHYGAHSSLSGGASRLQFHWAHHWPARQHAGAAGRCSCAATATCNPRAQRL